MALFNLILYVIFAILFIALTLNFIFGKDITKFIAGAFGAAAAVFATGQFCGEQYLRFFIYIFRGRMPIILLIGAASGFAAYFLARFISFGIYALFIEKPLKKRIMKGGKYNEFYVFMNRRGNQIYKIEQQSGSGGFICSFVPNGNVFIEKDGQLEYNEAESEQKSFFEINSDSERYWTAEEESVITDLVDDIAVKQGLKKQRGVWLRPLDEEADNSLKDPY